MFRAKRKITAWVAVPILLVSLARIGLASVPTAQKPAALAEKIRHTLVMLPYYNVFDSLSFTIEGSNTVVLQGQVTQPILKSDAEAAARRIEGVEKIVNHIEILPLSPFDDSIRWRAYRAIYSRPGFEKYGIQAVPPIHIIVKNGNITLDGVVGSQMDRTLADMAARSVPGSFSVTNNLKVV